MALAFFNQKSWPGHATAAGYEGAIASSNSGDSGSGGAGLHPDSGSNGQNNPAVLEELAAASLTSMWDVEREETSSVAAGPNT